MNDKLQKLMNQALSGIENSMDMDALTDIRIGFLGKKGEITSIMKEMKNLSPEERPAFGQMVNEVRSRVEEALEMAKSRIQEAVREKGWQKNGST